MALPLVVACAASARHAGATSLEQDRFGLKRRVKRSGLSFDPNR